MTEHRSYRQRLDAAGRTLVRGTRQPRVNIDAIVGDPQLFDKVITRIAVEPRIAQRRRLLTPLRTVVACVAAILIVAGVAGLRTVSRYQVLPNIAAVQVPDADPVSVRPDNPPKPTFRKLPSGRAEFTEAKATVIRRSDKRAAQIPTVDHAVEPAGNFYAVSFAGDTSDLAGARIVRVDMPRASLFAMGINIPIENDREVIKTDLLIGSDGSTRAVRIVD